jgi:hypothetical protein
MQNYKIINIYVFIITFKYLSVFALLQLRGLKWGDRNEEGKHNTIGISLQFVACASAFRLLC